MESKFHGLPPSKRFRLMHQEQEQENQNNGVSSSCLPAKKQKQSRDSPPLVAESSGCLPAKKRVWALQPHLVPNKPISPFDVEYNPQFDEEGIDPQKEKEVPIASDGNQIAETKDDRENEAEAEAEDEDNGLGGDDMM
ncbi:uncharacterized protein LOC130789726 [Actinidia eriantha]|uniref:uncharacterized protein LOC130789726 n=1 Tax=Actinidia eriantha TaxID=165200 RepID=UPI0025900487|nr:uncharacterized protein LOC130789726 [Actinidia eriantha]